MKFYSSKLFLFLSVVGLRLKTIHGRELQQLTDIQTTFNCLDNCTVLANNFISDDCFQLTDDMEKQTGVVWTVDPIEIGNSFTIDAALYFGTNDGNGIDPGADGIALVLQSVGPHASGNAGGGIGYSGISPSLGVEFDTFKNIDEIVEDHVALVEGNLNGGILDGPHGLIQNLEDGTYHNISFSWNSETESVTVTLDDVLVVNHTTVMSSILDASFAYVGFTSSTGLSTNVHEVCIKSIKGTLHSSESPSVSAIPSMFPSNVPTPHPSSTPSSSAIPSQEPSNFPSITVLPSLKPSARPSGSNSPSSAPSCAGKKGKKSGGGDDYDDDDVTRQKKKGKKLHVLGWDCHGRDDDDDDDDDGSYSVPGGDDDYVVVANGTTFRLGSIDASGAKGFGETSIRIIASSAISWFVLFCL